MIYNKNIVKSILFVLLLLVIDQIECHVVWNKTISFGVVGSTSQSFIFNDIQTPDTIPYALEAMHVVLYNESSGQRIERNQVDSFTVSLYQSSSSSPSPLITFYTSSFINPLWFPQPYSILINSGLILEINITMIQDNQDVSMIYYMNGLLNNTLKNIEPFEFDSYDDGSESTSSGGDIETSNTIIWNDQTMQGMSFQAIGDDGIISLTLIEHSTATVICKSIGLYDLDITGYQYTLSSMTPCTNTYTFSQGLKYTTIATYNTTIIPSFIQSSKFIFYIGEL